MVPIGLSGGDGSGAGVGVGSVAGLGIAWFREVRRWSGRRRCQ